ncbi:AMP-binding protein [Luteolibacter sp. SL250]|uniref:AMP-binding protein n=1 Tax=Luteolibacter sp. SL250 TaxID=2995170 RepID=UPI0022704770|nr:AMP-binding protein [Luteolibacter sp. SL250]WAC19847.1 AMP-binding protein [Luteolibacter sp. SL250]
MDAALLTDPSFWDDPRPFAPGDDRRALPELPQLEGHVLFQTSGSTGTPKWIALSKSALLLSAACVNRHLGVTEDSRWGLTLPLHHVGGFGVAARCFEAACDCSTYPGKWNAAEFRKWAAERAITHTSMVPTQVHDLVASNLAAPSALRAIVVGGGRLDERTGQAARDLGWPVLASYGMTETSSQIATQSPELLNFPYQTGGIPLLDIWDARAGDDGILEISGPALFSGSLRKDEAGCWIYEERSSEWHRTSDRVLLRERHLTPLGRADQVVKVLGELVDPEEIERELTAISCGILAPGTFAVVPVPDARAEHRLVPVFKNPIPPELVLNLLKEYEIHAPGYRRLQPPVFTESLPCSPLGKILRADLRKLAGG